MQLTWEMTYDMNKVIDQAENQLLTCDLGWSLSFLLTYGSFMIEKAHIFNFSFEYTSVKPLTFLIPFFHVLNLDMILLENLQVKNPQQDLPVGIGIALSSCCILYMLVSAVIVGLVPYYALDPDTPISSAFAHYGMEWAA